MDYPGRGQETTEESHERPNFPVFVSVVRRRSEPKGTAPKFVWTFEIAQGLSRQVLAYPTRREAMDARAALLKLSGTHPVMVWRVFEAIAQSINLAYLEGKGVAP